MNGKVLAIYVAPFAGKPMQSVLKVEAIAGQGLKGDRYCGGHGSFNSKEKGVRLPAGRQGFLFRLKMLFRRWLKIKRQVTLIASEAFEGTDFSFDESRRNIVTEGVELMGLIGKQFQVGDTWFYGVKYCDPCARPSNLCGKKESFKEAFRDRGGLIVEVREGGFIKVGDLVIPPKKNY